MRHSSLILAVQALGSYPILVAGSEEQKKRLCPPLASGEKVAAYALSETGCGSDAAAMKTRAKRYGNEYVLNGTKQFITGGSVAGTLVVFAQTDPEAGQPRHLGVRARAGDEPVGGVEARAQARHPRLAHRAARLRGRQGAGRQPARRGRGGLQDRARRARPLAPGHRRAGARHRRGRVRLRAQLREGAATSSGSRSRASRASSSCSPTSPRRSRPLVTSCYRAATKVDSKAPDLTKIAAMAKLFASDMAMRVTTDCVQLLGGYGYISDYPVERMMRDAKITQIYEGHEPDPARRDRPGAARGEPPGRSVGDRDGPHPIAAWPAGRLPAAEGCIRLRACPAAVGCHRRPRHRLVSPRSPESCSGCRWESPGWCSGRWLTSSASRR